MEENTDRDRGMSEPLVAVIEDPFVRKLLRDILAKHGYRVVEATAHQVVDLLTTGAGDIDMVITNAPGELLEFAQELPVLYLAACPDPELAARFRCCRALKKPFHTERLLTALNELKEQGAMAESLVVR